MMTRKQPLLLTAVLICLSTVSSFAPAPMSPSRTLTRIRPRINQVATPFEEMEKEEEKEKEKDDSDWTAVEGGFLPRIGRRKQQMHPLITEVSTLEDYKAEVVDCEEQIVVVKFYSTWCRSCKAMAPLYKKLANSLSDNPNIKFVQVPVTQHNTLLHQGLGIPSVPFGHIYHKQGGLVEELKIKKQDFGDFKDVLQSYVDGSCNTDLAP